jgi:hypothetical protein
MHEELPSSSPVPMLLLPAVERVAFVATRATCFNWTLSHGLEPARRIDAYRSPGRVLLARFNVVTSLSEYASPRRDWQFRPFLRNGQRGFLLGLATWTGRCCWRTRGQGGLCCCPYRPICGTWFTCYHLLVPQINLQSSLYSIRVFSKKKSSV